MDTFNKCAEAMPSALKTVAGLLHDTDPSHRPSGCCAVLSQPTPGTENRKLGIISGLLRRQVEFDRGLLCSYTFPLTTDARLGNLAS